MKFLLISISTLFLAQVAVAGGIDGKVRGWSSDETSSAQPAVVWVDGVKKFTVPHKNQVMTQRKGEFLPPFLVIVAGQTVEMPNEDEVAHNVYSDSPTKSFNLGYYAKGDYKSVTFDRPGVVDVSCSIHKFMHGLIYVAPNPYYATVEPDGAFHIRNVPPGTYRVKFWRNGVLAAGQEVTVPSAGSTVLYLDVASGNVTARN